ncbi:hypothetical protein AGABI2DRAFT_193654 [Agaricus bisporus var. bisporus H97]|uniref:hypothetical protein n=1 Tax=Agaricus bisporus var. bisporus (strain H97 / ATCC MYA-4626 / FGSC 10389) TaxID=936046 RepID=UPI00029F77A2|nr:hypothetical protein AGABI2DRAFT_193654 [Agaricus bisporus var. bisporus H97]EKV45707.1 hypothetical protein AGABI2DRAFT_193654 [Agaricus bisporus var. bisporus H97]
MAPLAGKPPFATDEPDTFYESQPQAQRRARPPPPPNPNARTSAYNVYDNYLAPGDEGNAEGNRQSGVGALGMGLLNMADSDDDSDDEGPNKRRLTPASKNAALAVATGATSRSPTNPFLTDPQPVVQTPSPTIAAPRPGYAAPIAALNLANSEPVTTTRAPPAPAPIAVPMENPFEPPMAQVYPPHSTPMPSPSLPPSSPHPLQPSITPITPVFARPAKAGNLTFSEPIPRAKPIMRGGSEGTLLPRRGEKGDDFWRRFSMVAKIENGSGSKESWWLKKTRSGTTRLSRWVWVIAIALVLCIVAASVIGWKVSQSHPDHQAPEAIGGSANERPESETVAASATGSSIKHVTPTHTVARRVASMSGLPSAHTRAVERRKRLFDSVIAH